jgi:hypothetical protein
MNQPSCFSVNYREEISPLRYGPRRVNAKVFFGCIKKSSAALICQRPRDQALGVNKITFTLIASAIFVADLYQTGYGSSQSCYISRSVRGADRELLVAIKNEILFELEPFYSSG